MSIIRPKGRPGRLSDALRQVKQAFELMHDATPILVGRHHLAHGPGVGARVVLAPWTHGGMAPGQFLGDAASVSQGCDVYIRGGGTEIGDDIDRFAAAEELADRVISCLERAMSGRLTWGEARDDSPATVDALGAGIAFSFLYTHGVEHDPLRDVLPPADEDADDPREDDGGVTADAVAVEPNTTSKEG